MNIQNLFNSEERAVSPVIGVILMVAITVILAAVIGTFVLGLGDQVGSSAPQASFSTSDVTNNSGTGAGTMTFTLEKTGGQDLDTGDLRLSVGGDVVDNPDFEGEIGTSWQTGASGTFTSGETFDEGDRVTITLIHEPSGDQVYRTTVTMPSGA